MSGHFKWYPSSEDVVVPWNARYSFPSQANKAVKITPRIPPKNGSAFKPGSMIRVEFPAQGYVNPANTTLSFDVTLNGMDGAAQQLCRFQNNIQSIFSRVRLLYGSTPLEDIINYNVIVRNLTEWTAGTGRDQCSIAEGIGATSVGQGNGGTTGIIHTRQNNIQGFSAMTATTPVNFECVAGAGLVPNGQALSSASSVNPSTRRYQISFALGMFCQEKLIPTKFMASQLAIEITLEQPQACIIAIPGSGITPTKEATYTVDNVVLIPEILEFDASYDAMFLRGLQEGGVPIKFSSWHTFPSTISGAAMNVMIQERSRSVKALFAVQRRNPPTFTTDSGACFYDTSAVSSGTGGTLQNYQYRIGGRYFPAAPVQCSLSAGSQVSNGAAEAYTELSKALKYFFLIF